MRDFNDADRKKKKKRIELPENPGNLAPAALAKLEQAVLAARVDGFVKCPTAWRVAKDEGVSKLDVGVMIDKLGVRVVDCQLGCFAVSKTDHLGEPAAVGAETARRVAALHEAGELTCANVFALAVELGEKPRAVADAANTAGYKLSRCQLGCF